MTLSLIDLFDKGVAIKPDRPCLVGAGETLSYREAQASSCLIGSALVRSGVPRGTRIAVLGPNTNRSFECVLGTLRAGCTWVPVNARNALEETVYVLDHTDAGVLFYSAMFASQVPEIVARCPKLNLVVCSDGAGIADTLGFAEWSTGASDVWFEVPVGPDALATLACSGGTTGRPKGVRTSHRTWAFRIAEVMQRLAHPAPVHLVAAPMTHGAGAGALELMALGAVHVVQPGFDATAVFDAIEQHGVTHVFMPPTALYRLLVEPGAVDRDLSSLCYLMCGGAPIPPERMEQALALFGDAFHVGYGGTEFGGGICWHPGAEMRRAIAAGNRGRLLSCGRPSPLSRVDVRGPDGRLLAPGESGEIVIDGYVLASGYHKDEAETAQAFRPEGFYTGDLGYKDEAGWVYLSDRRKDMIISGGFNVYPSEIEAVLVKHAAVRDCAVVGLPDEHWGEAVTAVIDCAAATPQLADELKALCRNSLAGYKVPKHLVFWDSLPKSPVGKVLKRAIRDRLARGE
ncbi:MAG: AMP-binding protein [Rhodocyclaceae bacterium]|nr:AMP-binding protein [Rhodocyclaceae bacterium]